VVRGKENSEWGMGKRKRQEEKRNLRRIGIEG
jgi:hypothetical protein